MPASTALHARVLTTVGLSVLVHAAVLAGWRPFTITPPRLAAFEPVEVMLEDAPAPRIAAAPRPVLRPLATPAPQPAPVASSPPAAEPAPAADSPSETARSEEPLVEARSDVAALNNPKPSYPLAARRRGIEGRVLLAARVSAEGACTDVRLKQSSGHALLDESALSAVRRWRFVPAHRGAAAVDSWVDVPVSFRLEG
jgi:protein TonB